jgi:hypothetical protein
MIVSCLKISDLTSMPRFRPSWRHPVMIVSMLTTPCHDRDMQTTPCHDRVMLTTPCHDRDMLTTPCHDRVMLTTPCHDRVMLTTPCHDSVMLTTPCHVQADKIQLDWHPCSCFMGRHRPYIHVHHAAGVEPVQHPV